MPKVPATKVPKMMVSVVPETWNSQKEEAMPNAPMAMRMACRVFSEACEYQWDSIEFSGSGVAPRMVERSTIKSQLAEIATGRRHSEYTANASHGESSCTNAAMMAPAAAARPTPDATDRVMSLVCVPPNLGRPKRVVSKEASCNQWL